MEAKDLSAAALSRKSGVSKQVLSLWLSGTKPRNIYHLKSVAAALDTTIDNLVFGTGKGSEAFNEGKDFKGAGWISGVFEVKFRRVKS